MDGGNGTEQRPSPPATDDEHSEENGPSYKRAHMLKALWKLSQALRQLQKSVMLLSDQIEMEAE